VTSSVADQRRSTAWALLFVALFVITAPAMAAFAKLIIFRDIALAPASALPAWLLELSEQHLLQAADINRDGAISAAELLIARDGITLALPAAAGLPYVLIVLMATAALAIALAASASHLFTLAGSLAEDLYRVLDRNQSLPRLVAAWAAIAATALAAAVFLVIADVDPLRAALMAFAFTAATFFPALVLAIWWRRCAKWGAMAALTTGFTIMLGDAIFGGTLGIAKAGFTTSLASLVGAALALMVGSAVSLYRRQPSQVEDLYYEEMRDPGGETIYDRAQLRAAAAAAASTAAAEQQQ
jgi:cation/acetate symporter